MLVYFAPLLLFLITVILTLCYLKKGVLTYLWILFLVFLTMAWYTVITCVPPIVQLMFCSIYAITILFSVALYSTSLKGADYQTLDFIFFFCVGYIFFISLLLGVLLLGRGETEASCMILAPFIIYCVTTLIMVLNGY